MASESVGYSDRAILFSFCNTPQFPMRKKSHSHHTCLPMIHGNLIFYLCFRSGSSQFPSLRFDLEFCSVSSLASRGRLEPKHLQLHSIFASPKGPRGKQIPRAGCWKRFGTDKRLQQGRRSRPRPSWSIHGESAWKNDGFILTCYTYSVWVFNSGGKESRRGEKKRQPTMQSLQVERELYFKNMWPVSQNMHAYSAPFMIGCGRTM